MTTRLVALLFLFAVIPSAALPPVEAEWGFYGHRRLNRLAVFTLPPELIGFFKKHIEYITEHAVDPDKRRYATRHEAVRHYIDIDHWGEYPFPDVPREWPEALARYLEVFGLEEDGDTVALWHYEDAIWSSDSLFWTSTFDDEPEEGEVDEVRTVGTSRKKLSALVRSEILPQYYEDEWRIHPDTFSRMLDLELPDDLETIRAIDHFSEYGIVPYHLKHMQERLTVAFREEQLDRLLRLAAEMGHYIGDAHVPLHTTENYNGQLTNQVGIHAFWESRIPELFEEEEFDPFVGKAEYIADPQSYYWEVVLASHRLVDSVLLIEKRLSQTYPSDQQFCFDERLGRTIRIQCRDYAKAYQQAMDGMVEARWRATIQAIGSSWYTAWIDAGQPDLKVLRRQEEKTDRELEEQEELDAAFRSGLPKGRKHDN